MAINATPKSPTANAYITLAAANAYLSDRRLYTGEWTAATTAEREAAIIWAASLIDQAFDFYGAVSDIYQALSWPRLGVIDRNGRYVDPDTIPQIVADANAELAYHLAKQDRTALSELVQLGIEDAAVGPIRVTLSGSMSMPIIPETVVMMLSPFGELVAGQGGAMKTVRLRRT